MDFVYIKNGGLLFRNGGAGSKNSDYYCFGQPVLAPADGTVIKAEAGYETTIPARPARIPDGNVIIISHGNGEYFHDNHLKQNSLKLKLEDMVKQVIRGRVRQRGASTAPDLHYENTAGFPVPELCRRNSMTIYADGKRCQ